MSPFLRPTLIVDWDHPEVLALASYLSKGYNDPLDLTRRMFEWVRDEVAHSWEHQKKTVVLKASEVLKNKHGCCFAKSHLLAALLRANGIAVAFSYQRIPNEFESSSFRLHGLNAIYLAHLGWFRADATGGESGKECTFSPEGESLVYPDLFCMAGIWPHPLDCVVEALINAEHVHELYRMVPDMPAGRITPE